MQIILKLYAGLGEYLPSGTRDNTLQLQIAGNATPHGVLDSQRVPREKVHLLLLNGVYLAVPERDTHPLRDGDVLAAWPPVAGG